MTSLLGRIFNHRPVTTSAPMRGDIAYAEVMRKSDDLLHRVNSSPPPSPSVVAVIVDIWSQRRNIPFLTTVVEAVEEGSAAIKQRPDDWPPK